MSYVLDISDYIGCIVYGSTGQTCMQPGGSGISILLMV